MTASKCHRQGCERAAAVRPCLILIRFDGREVGRMEAPTVYCMKCGGELRVGQAVTDTLWARVVTEKWPHGAPVRALTQILLTPGAAAPSLDALLAEAERRKTSLRLR